MVRMSDILKKARERRNKEEKASPEPEPRETSAQASAPPQPPKQEILPQPQPAKPEEIKAATESAFTHAKKKEEKEKAEEEKPKASEVRISSVVMKGGKTFSNEETMGLYGEMISLTKELIKMKEIDFKSIDIKKVASYVEKIIEQFNLGNEKILLSTFTPHEDYLPYHIANVSIYSINIGIGLRYDKSELMELGISALLHDVGMARYLDLAYQPRKLSAEEFEAIKNHAEVGLHLLESVISLNEVILHAVYQEHERSNGLGYPRGLKGDSINRYAKVIAIADVYEAMIHPRPYRNNTAKLPSEAIKEILENKDAFEHKIVKILIERIGIFPVGSFVELNTKDVAQVIKHNHKYPLRPVVKVTYDNEGNRLEEEKIIDLTTQCDIYTAKCLSIEKVVP